MDLGRLRAVWKRVFALAWPVMAEQTFRTAMRTTDVLVTALFSPAAVVAIGLADLYARFPLRIGLGLGGGAIALSSQDTGAENVESRDEAVNAGFQIGRRIYQQVTGPLSRGYNVAASVLVGQSLGQGDPNDARYDGRAVAALGVLTVGGIGLLLAVAAPWGVGLFTSDPETGRYATAFTRVYGLAGGVLVAFSALSGGLQGASETRIPLAARTSGMFGFFLGLSWLLGETLGFGPVGAYVGVVAAYAWMALVVAWGFERSDWAGRAANLMAERGSAG